MIHLCEKQGIALRGHIEDSKSACNYPCSDLIKMFAAEYSVLHDHIA